jgi:hypothetical protein
LSTASRAPQSLEWRQARDRRTGSIFDVAIREQLTLAVIPADAQWGCYVQEKSGPFQLVGYATTSDGAKVMAATVAENWPEVRELLAARRERLGPESGPSGTRDAVNPVDILNARKRVAGGTRSNGGR